MGNIVLLDDLTINKIAAGEVIERPASVVKEIVENSIDAGATNITVEIKSGGISYIRVTDNGKGIMQDDMEIAFERHATSKLRNAEDLNEIKSMGFRGEALASIASIAKVELISKTKESENGYKVVIEGGKIIEKEETGCPEGTSITVENLFYNTPVRYKFLRKDFTESGYIEDAITRIALINPNISIKLVNSGKVIIQTSGNGDVKSIIYNIYGKDVSENLINIDYTYEEMHITGVVGKPVISRSNRSNQLFFVNKRYVKDKTLSSAAEQAFKGLITIGKHGFLVLNIDMNPKKVDVNVHPTKLEIRFQEESQVFKAVYHSIKDGLLKNDLIPDTYVAEETKKEDSNNLTNKTITNGAQLLDIENTNKTIFKDIFEKRQENKEKDKINDTKIIENNTVKPEKFDKVLNDLEKMKNIVREDPEKNIISDPEKIIENGKSDVEVSNIETETSKKIIPSETEIHKEEEKIKTIQSEPEFDEMYEKMFGRAIKREEQEEDNKGENIEKAFKPITSDDNMSVFEEQSKYSTKPAYKYIGIAFNTYIILEIKKDLYIIDQHAAHERIMYEKVKANYYNDKNKDSQLMLLPDVIPLTHKEMGIFEDNKKMFKKAGFIVEEFGENTVKLSGVPNILLDIETKALFLEALDEINTVARTAKQEIEEKFIATVACKAAVKAHMALSKEEVEQLLDNLLVLPNPFTCPHGRPTAIRMTKNDIEKKFSRK